jgi:hypothetical protein
MILRLQHLVLEITLNSRYILLVKAIHFLLVVVAAGSDCDPSGCFFCPFLPPLEPFLGPLLVALDGAAQATPGTIFQSPKTKAAPTTSSL